MRHIEVYLNGVALTEACPRASISQLTEEASSMGQITGERPGTYGIRIFGNHTKQKKITIEFVILETADLDFRARAQEAAAGWCRDGYMTMSNRPGRRIWVHCVSRPSIGAARDYTQMLRAEFVTGAVPFWEDDKEQILALGTGTETAGTATPVFTAERAPLQARITASGADLDGFDLGCNGAHCVMQGIDLESGSTLAIAYDMNGILTIGDGTTDMLMCRTPSSPDDLWLRSGMANEITFEAETAAVVQVFWRGWYV